VRSKKAMVLIAILAPFLAFEPIASQSAEEPSKPSSRRAQEAICSDDAPQPSWCAEIGLGRREVQSWVDGKWTVTLQSDEMDVDKRATLSTQLAGADGFNEGWIELTVWNGGSVVSHSANNSILRNFYRDRERWPYCAGNLDRISVDGAEVQYIATIERGGKCNQIALNGRAIIAMKRGKNAKMRLGRNNTIYHIDLQGFTAAMRRAVRLTKR